MERNPVSSANGQDRYVDLAGILIAQLSRSVDWRAPLGFEIIACPELFIAAGSAANRR
jgi:hypothetical protein